MSRWKFLEAWCGWGWWEHPSHRVPSEEGRDFWCLLFFRSLGWGLTLKSRSPFSLGLGVGWVFLLRKTTHWYSRILHDGSHGYVLASKETPITGSTNQVPKTPLFLRKCVESCQGMKRDGKNGFSLTSQCSFHVSWSSPSIFFTSMTWFLCIFPYSWHDIYHNFATVNFTLLLFLWSVMFYFWFKNWHHVCQNLTGYSKQKSRRFPRFTMFHLSNPKSHPPWN